MARPYYLSRQKSTTRPFAEVVVVADADAIERGSNSIGEHFVPNFESRLAKPNSTADRLNAHGLVDERCYVVMLLVFVPDLTSAINVNGWRSGFCHNSPGTGR